MIQRTINYTRRTQGEGGRTDGDYTEGVVRYFLGRNLLLESHFSSCEIAEYCAICGSYGTADGYSCNCHEYLWAPAWYALRDLLRALSGERDKNIPGWLSLKKEEVLERVAEEVTTTNQAYAVLAMLDLLKEVEGS